jgi:hypothetical protein
MSTSRRISAAIAVRWTPAMAARVQRRIQGQVARRRRRRRVAAVVLAFLGVGGVAMAFTRGFPRFSRHGHEGAAPAAKVMVAPPAASAPLLAAPAAAAPSAPSSAPVPQVAPPVAAAPKVRARTVASVPRGPQTVDALFAAADAARLADRPGDAVAPLTAILNRHASDPRAAIAAYQLGRVFALDLHDPARAAAAYSRAHDLDPHGPLAADAAAHAAEARRAAQTEAR